jgi:hypothetical protein
MAGLLFLVGFDTGTAFGASVTDPVNITVGVSGNVSGFSQVSAFGAADPTATSDGYAYEAITANQGVCHPNGCTAGNNIVAVGGFTASPGATWLTSVAWGGCTLHASTATSFSYASGVASWVWNGVTCDFGSPGSVAPVSVVHSQASGASGWITPKFQVVGITYAPPGVKSTATYSTGFLSGTATSSSSSFKVGVTESDTFSSGFDLFGVLDSNAMQAYSAGWSQTSGSNNSISITQQYSTGVTLPGPPSNALGVDHDYDLIFIWLNPAVQMTIYGTRAVTINGFNWDARDTITGIDVIGLTLGQLRGTQPITGETLTRLQRTWDTNLGALTSTDYLAIAATDVFYNNPVFNPNTDTSHRFEFPNGVDTIFNYVPSATPVTETYTSSYNTTSTNGQSASQEFTVGYSIEGGASASFILALSGTIKVSATLTYTNQWSSTVTSGKTQTANFTIVEPVFSDDYTGPTAMQIWKDNIYGTFMFYPEN